MKLDRHQAQTQTVWEFGFEFGVCLIVFNSIEFWFSEKIEAFPEKKRRKTVHK
jgi:hypothetical protein